MAAVAAAVAGGGGSGGGSGDGDGDGSDLREDRAVEAKQQVQAVLVVGVGGLE